MRLSKSLGFAGALVLSAIIGGTLIGSALATDDDPTTTDDADALIGLGASAIGRLPQGFVQNAPDAGGYSRAVSSGRYATTKGLALTDDDRIRGSVIERLMCELAVDLAPFGGWDRFAPEVAKLAPLEQQGLVMLGGERIAVTESGRPYLRLVAAVFDSYLAGAGKRHSIAV